MAERDVLPWQREVLRQALGVSKDVVIPAEAGRTYALTLASRLFAIPPYVLNGPVAGIARRRSRLTRMHSAYRRRRR
jgi:hypothetical protein